MFVKFMKKKVLKFYLIRVVLSSKVVDVEGFIAGLQV